MPVRKARNTTRMPHPAVVEGIDLSVHPYQKAATSAVTYCGTARLRLTPVDRDQRCRSTQINVSVCGALAHDVPYGTSCRAPPPDWPSIHIHNNERFFMTTGLGDHREPEISCPESPDRTDRAAPRRRRVGRVARVTSLVAALAVALVGCAEAGAAPRAPSVGAPPTIVLVHGAFADASSWNGVVSRLQRDGYDVVAPVNPLRGLTADSAYMASYLKQLGGRTLLVGHSYGGAVITNAAYDASNVHGLVYVAGFAPDAGEVLGDVEKTSKDSVLNSALLPTHLPHRCWWRPNRNRIPHRPAEVPQCLRCRPPRRRGRAAGRHSATRRPGRILRGVGPAGVEETPLLGCCRDR